jgi:hypothetical protein
MALAPHSHRQPVQSDDVRAVSSSLSYSGVHFDLGAMEKIRKIEIRWPSGTVQVPAQVKPDQVLTANER